MPVFYLIFFDLASNALIMVATRPMSLRTCLCPSQCVCLRNERCLWLPGGSGDIVAQWEQCVCLVPGDKEPSLISIICFPRWQGQGKREAWWKDSSCRVTLILPHKTLTTTPEAKFPALTGDTRALVGFTVREKKSFMFSFRVYSHVLMLQPDEFNRKIERSKEKLTQEGDISTCYLKKQGENAKKGMQLLWHLLFSNTISLLT